MTQHYFHISLPVELLGRRGQMTHGTKKSKLRITKKFCCDLIGEKEEPLVNNSSLRLG